MRRHRPQSADDAHAYSSAMAFHSLRGVPLQQEETARAVLHQLLLIGVSEHVIGWADFVFASFSAQYKIDEEVWSVWMQLLKHVPRSVLWLVNFNDESSDNIMALARAHLGEEHWRVVITLLLPRKVETVVKGYWADLALDTWLINGHTTAAETGWHGLPMVVMPGSLHYHARLSSSIMLSLASASSLPCPSPSRPTAHLISRNTDDYFQIASAFARSAVADRGSWRSFVPNVLAGTLFDGEIWAQSWERGLKMARDVQMMTADNLANSTMAAVETIAACGEVLRGGEEGVGVTPKSFSICARAMAGKGAHTRLLGFNIIVFR